MTATTTARELAVVLGRYPLATPLITGEHEAGIINDNRLVEDASGGRFFLRGYRRVREAPRVLFQLRFQEYLRAQGFPTAVVIRTNDGELFVTIKGMPWALFACVAGEEFDFSRLPQAWEAGRRLAQFHAIAEDYDAPVSPVTKGEIDFTNLLAPPSSHIWRDSVLSDEHDERLRQLFGGAEFAPDLAFFSEWRRRAAAAWPGDRLAALPRSWLHCDYHGRNMVFQGDEMAGLFDFDFVTRGPRTFDVGRGLFNFGRERRSSRVLRAEFCRAFLEGYEALAPLSAEERDSLGFMAVLNWAPDANFYRVRRSEEGDARIAERLRADAAMMRVMDAQVRRLAPEFRVERRLMRVGIGYDVHRFEAGRVLVLGGVTLAGETGLGGHSDADVLLHAITDALLGAAGLGDIGTHFPDGGPQWKDADSAHLLERAVALVREAGYAPENVDATVIAEKPRLAPHVPAMRQRIAALLGVAEGAVNVKATTNEGIGEIGHGEGIAAVAVVLLRPLSS